jgi:uncharacterized protein (TIGR00369 family)
MHSHKTNKTIAFFKGLIDKDNVSYPSGVGKWLQPVLKDISFGRIVAEIIVRPEMINTHQTLHGGMTSLIFDEIIGATVYCLEKETSFVTVSLNVDFLSAAKLGDTVRVATVVQKNGNTLVQLDAKMYVHERLIAVASSVLVSTGKAKVVV